MKGLGALLLAVLIHLSTADVKTDGSPDANRAVYHVVYGPQSQPDTYGYENTYRSYDDSHRGGYRYQVTDTYGAYPSAYDSSAESLFLSGGIFRPYGYDDDSHAYDFGGNKPYAYDMRHYGGRDGRYAKYPYSRRQYA